MDGEHSGSRRAWKIATDALHEMWREGARGTRGMSKAAASGDGHRGAGGTRSKRRRIHFVVKFISRIFVESIAIVWGDGRTHDALQPVSGGVGESEGRRQQREIGGGALGPREVDKQALVVRVPPIIVGVTIHSPTEEGSERGGLGVPRAGRTGTANRAIPDPPRRRRRCHRCRHHHQHVHVHRTRHRFIFVTIL